MHRRSPGRRLGDRDVQLPSGHVVDRDARRPGPHHEPRLGHDHRAHGTGEHPITGQHTTNADPASNGVQELRLRTTAVAHDDEIDGIDASQTKGLEHVLGIRTVLDHDEVGTMLDRPASGPPQARAPRNAHIDGLGHRQAAADHARHDRRQRHGEAAPNMSTTPVAKPQDHDCTQRQRGTGRDLPQRERAHNVGHPGHPPQQQPGRQMDHRGRPAPQQSGRKTRDDPPPHHRFGRRERKDVGRDGCERHAAEHGYKHDHRADLCGDSGGQRCPHPQGPRQGPPERSVEERDSETGADGQPEADRVGQHRIDQQEHRHGQREDAQWSLRTTEMTGQQDECGHHRGPQHRWFEAGHGCEHDEDHQRAYQASTPSDPRQQRLEGGQRERDVLPGND